MKLDTWVRLDREFEESPIMRAQDVPTEDEINAASREIGIAFPQDYRDFLTRYGGAMVGPYPVYGLRPVHVMGVGWSVVDLTRRIRSGGLDVASNWIVFSEDHSGNPIGMDADGRVWIFDHDFGGVAQLALDFEEYIRRTCLKVSGGVRKPI
jgi:cell wall assembly regulator SMI1